MCNIYKFKATGWKNLNASGFLGFFFGGLLLIVLSFERKVDGKRKLWFEEYVVAIFKFCQEHVQAACHGLWTAMANCKAACSRGLARARGIRGGTHESNN
jgi:hypothetical protein